MQLATHHEEYCFDNAVYFTAIRGRTPAKRTRQEFDTFEAAKSASIGDDRTMIYAVTKTGNAAHICNV